ncbi:MAG: DUF4266 domain-containing protein [Lewinellaceae bacterium]|nr:DUF4266 domain-containing protein [Lewinellaceae bacterium]
MANKTLYCCMLAWLTMLACAGCQQVKPYQRVYLNDQAMQPGHRPGCKFEQNVQTYREGATGGGSGKSGGGCGCN